MKLRYEGEGGHITNTSTTGSTNTTTNTNTSSKSSGKNKGKSKSTIPSVFSTQLTLRTSEGKYLPEDLLHPLNLWALVRRRCAQMFGWRPPLSFTTLPPRDYVCLLREFCLKTGIQIQVCRNNTFYYYYLLFITIIY